MKRLKTALAAVVLGAGLASCLPVSERALQVAKLTGVAADGQPVFERDCVSCHGADGKGTELAMNSGHKVNLVTAGAYYSAAEFITVVIDGTPGTTMQGYPSFTDQQLADLYAYMRSLPK
jgi:mono/diheme cytochrome c family protein